MHTSRCAWGLRMCVGGGGSCTVLPRGRRHKRRRLRRGCGAHRPNASTRPICCCNKSRLAAAAANAAATSAYIFCSELPRRLRNISPIAVPTTSGVACIGARLRLCRGWVTVLRGLCRALEAEEEEARRFRAAPMRYGPIDRCEWAAAAACAAACASAAAQFSAVCMCICIYVDI